MKKQRKLWLIVGGIEGLGLASIKYILSKDAFVVALTPDIDLFEQSTGLIHPNLRLISYRSTFPDTLSFTLTHIREQFGYIDYYLNHQSAEDVARQWEMTELNQQDFEKVFSQQAVHLSEEVLVNMAKASWAHIFFVSFKVKTEPLGQIANARIQAIKSFVNRHEEDLKSWSIKLSIIDENNCIHNFEARETVFRLPFEN
jgi:NAD(P)-dependent dehydrogenase (short-subunit alcohol dehydrogenase family)